MGYTNLMDFGSVFHKRQLRRFTSKYKRLRLFKWLTILLVGGFLFSIVFMIGAFAWFSRDLPAPDKIVRREGFSTQIYSRDNELLYDIYNNVQREPVDFNNVPANLKNATVAVEDKNFYKHQGFDTTGMARAIFNIIVYRRLQGGSTLTQQLVKNVLLTSERTIPRKIKEFVLTVQIEKKFTKDEILKMYLQEAPYGGSAVGVEVAARTYFGKSAKDLNLLESAFLAGMPQSPTGYSPYGTHPTAYINRTKHVLKRMREDGYITVQENQEADNEVANLKFKTPGTSLKAPHFVMYVRDQLVQQFGENLVEEGGLKVTTTLDLPLQDKAQQIVSEEIDKVENLNISNGASLVMNPNTGEILAMIGSRDFFSNKTDGQVNVTLSSRQPGSAIKPVTYAAAFRKGYTPATMMTDAKISFDSGDPDQPYEPENYDGKFRGPVQLRYALGSSLNIPSIEILQLTGIRNMLSLAFDMGFKTLEPTAANMSRLGLSVTLGGGEVRLIDLISAYSAFANSGGRIDPVSILKVEDPRGKILYEYQPARAKQVLSPQESFLINNILSDNNARLLTFGENSLLNMGNRPVAVKTGTTNDRRDNWAIGWSNSMIVGSWVGNNDNSPMKQVASGVSGASPIWRRIMLEALNKYPASNFEIPSGIVSENVDLISGYKTYDGWPSRSEYFVEGTVPDGPDPIHTKLSVCKSDGKLAGPVEIAKGDTEDREFIILKSPTILSSADKTRWQIGFDAWISTQSDSRYHPPTESCQNSGDLLVRAKQPADHSRIDSNDIDWEVEVISDKKINAVELFVNGSSRQILNQSPWKSTIHLDDGAYTLKFKARTEDGKEAESGEIHIGVKKNWDDPPAGGTPSPTIIPTATPTPH